MLKYVIIYKIVFINVQNRLKRDLRRVIVETQIKKNDDISVYIENQEYIANTYVMKCFSVTMILYFLTFLLNICGIFIIDQSVMQSGFVPSLIIYFIVYLVTKKVSLSDIRTKYFILFCVVLVFTIIGMTITYHVVLIALLPFLYATLYSSKRVMRYVYGLTVISTIVVVYGGYYFGLCDANMVLLTSTKLQNYIVDGQFVLNVVNDNPAVTLMLFFVVPRCLIYIAFMSVCSGIFKLISGSLEKARRTAEMEEFQAELEKKVDEQTVELRDQQKKINDLYIQTVTALSEAVDAKDRYTSGHSKRVAEYSRMIAARMGKSKKEQEEIYRAGLLHDVGKIRIPVEIINKPGRLTDEEFNIIKIHPVTGYHILRGISGNSDIAIAAKYHHERYDGKGYPNGLEGENIPESARILGVADSYDAMTSNRSYRNALPQDVVRAEIEKGKGTQFDPYVADVMLQLMDEDIEYNMKQNDLTDRKILIVDDEPMNHRIIEHIIKEEGMYQIISAEGGREALDILEKEKVDVIMLDVVMPDMDGLETLRRIREKYQTPVVLMTADKTLDTSTEFAELGCDDYVTKPFLPLLIKEVIYNMTKN